VTLGNPGVTLSCRARVECQFRSFHQNSSLASGPPGSEGCLPTPGGRRVSGLTWPRPCFRASCIYHEAEPTSTSRWPAAGRCRPRRECKGAAAGVVGSPSRMLIPRSSAASPGYETGTHARPTAGQRSDAGACGMVGLAAISWARTLAYPWVPPLGGLLSSRSQVRILLGAVTPRG
jgi:hypothetical protein